MPLTGGNGCSDCAAAFNRAGQIETALTASVDGSCGAAAVEDTTEALDLGERRDIAVSAEVTAVGGIAELNAAEDVGALLPVAEAAGLIR